MASQAAPLGRSEREHIAASLGPLLAAFTGEHVNEPRRLICLYGPPVLHVDLKFLPAAQLNPRVEEATKLGRGELLEAVDFLGALRRFALGPLALERGGVRPDGVRRAESLPPDTVSMFAATVAPYHRAACYRALLTAIAFCREQPAALGAPSLVQRSQAEAQSVNYLHMIGRALGLDQ